MSPVAPLLATRAAEPVPLFPDWTLTPFALLAPEADGWHTRPEPPDSVAPTLTFAAQRLDINLAPGAQREVRMALGVGQTQAVALERLERALATHAAEAAERAGRRFLTHVPHFA